MMIGLIRLKGSCLILVFQCQFLWPQSCSRSIQKFKTHGSYRHISLISQLKQESGYCTGLLVAIQLCCSFSNQWAHLAQHVSSEQVVVILQDVYGGDGWLLMEAARLPALIPAATLPQVNAEDLPWSASIKQHRDLGTKGGVLCLPHSFTCDIICHIFNWT